MAVLPTLRELTLDLIVNEERRPGFCKLVERVARAYPTWRSDDLICEAKMLYTNRTLVKRHKSGYRVEVSNPDYQAARDRGFARTPQLPRTEKS